MKQIGIGLMQYTQDYDEKFPTLVRNLSGSEATTNKLSSDYTSFHEVIQPYVKSYQVLICPSGTNANVPKGPSQTDGNVRTSYAGATANGTIYAFSELNTTPSSLSEFNAPAETLLVGEPVDTSTRTTGNGMGPTGTVFYVRGNLPGNLHLEGANYLWVDGHVKWSRPEKTEQTIGGTANYYWLKVKP